MGYKSRKAGVLKNVTETFTAFLVIPPIGAAQKPYTLCYVWKDREGTASLHILLHEFPVPLRHIIRGEILLVDLGETVEKAQYSFLLIVNGELMRRTPLILYKSCSSTVQLHQFLKSI